LDEGALRYVKKKLKRYGENSGKRRGSTQGVGRRKSKQREKNIVG